MYFSNKFSFFFDNIYIQKKYVNKNITYFKSKEAIVKINSGLIIGTNEYKNYIDKIFFDYLIKKNICKIDLIDNYYVYYCYNLQFTGQTSQRYQTINHYEEFPSLIFNSKILEFNFELTNKDLFQIIMGRYYFLVIFDMKENEKWYFFN